ncbi:P22 phage major capsid protein family protein [Pseudoxanthomonas sp.]|uniref:P22 phage major capsid protein family protein n=1 Tax=Pseudoxanthomonas sp. TaxID=1871049 RepID=UPI00261B2278|nr:P22 phage major capsid protein family protein [Pseudoxanthomonas sp.]WDS36236.1 MAG: P22 phage major capsid protein family protein [Pseudoxanthomonas sp.]
MANTLITPDIIAKEALMQLENNLVMGKLVHREYRSEFKGGQGDSISIRKPVKFVASDGATRVNQDVQEAKTTFTIDKRKHVSWKFSTEDLTLSVEQYSERYIRPAMIALSNQVDSDLTALYKGIFQNVGTAGTAPSTFINFGEASMRLDNSAVPTEDRRLVLNPRAHLYAADLLKGLYNPELVKGAVRGISVGPLAGFETYMDQNVKKHTAGTWSAAGGAVNGASQNVTYANAVNTYGSTSQTLVVDGLSTNTVLAGDKFTIAGVYAVNPVSKETLDFLQEFVVLTDATVATGAASLTISPAIIIDGAFQTVSAAPADNAVITVSASYAANLAFHKNAFGLVTVPLALPDGAAFKARESANGYSVRVVKDYDIDSDDDVIRLDIMYGVKTLYPELACVLKG